MTTAPSNSSPQSSINAKEAIATTIANQTLAASPETSAWVNANAGSGKTRVLTNRVARLLLRGCEPSHILCLTFTKAAAVEMAHRLYDMLGEWALLSDEKLGVILAELETGMKEQPTTHNLSKARRLFARALETPGGLKIQTIHAFCTNMLQRFPLEAGVPPGFKAIEDAEIDNLIEQALANIVREVRPDSNLDQSLTHLSRNYGAQGLMDLLKSQINKRQDYLAATNEFKTVEDYSAALSNLFSLSPSITPQKIREKFLTNCTDGFLKEAIEILSNGGANAKKSTHHLVKACEAQHEVEKFDCLYLFFITKTTSTPIKHLTDKAIQKIDPTIDGKLKDLQTDYSKALNDINSITIIEDSIHLYTVFYSLLNHYEQLKWSQSALDFDDLIMHTSKLFNKEVSATQWVLYKLDNALQHILVDEAQDTSPWQWGVIEPPMDEFFAGENAHDEQRTFFAVGDQKQSIYSFQGADASVFKAKSLSIGERIEAAAKFKNVPLTLSFRSTSPVLNFVDAMFTGPKTMEGIDDAQQLNHGVARHQDAGIVELWPLVIPPPKPQSNAWDAPIDSITIDNPISILCNHIAQTIHDWITNKEILQSQNRPIHAGDIIILVQSRGPLFKQISKSLSRLNIPVAGVDRFNLLEDIAIQDLLSYGRCLLLPEDDLSLAETLKSPLFGFDDDMVFELAHDRDGRSLWANLMARQNEKTIWKETATRLMQARKIAFTKGAHEFYSHIIDGDQHSGRQRFFSRLGPICSDPIDSFLQQTLQFENENPRNLQGFISWIEKNAGTMKRELDQDIPEVRIMTVHGAKGLEGNIVFLLDTHKKPYLSKKGPIYYCDDPHKDEKRSYPTLVRHKNTHNTSTMIAEETIKRLAYEEYRRLLYVASTRAKDRLYVCGIGKAPTKSKPKKKTEEEFSTQSWYEIASDAFNRLEAGEPSNANGALSILKDIPWIEHQSPQENSEKSTPKHGFRLQTQQVAPRDDIEDTATEDKNKLSKDEILKNASWLRTLCPKEDTISTRSPSLLAESYERQSYIEIEDGSDQSDADITGQSASKQKISPPDTTIENNQNKSNEKSNTHSAHAYSPLGTDRYLRGRTLHRLLEILPSHPPENHINIADRLLQMLVPDHPDHIREEWRDEVIKVLHHKDFAKVFAAGSKAEVSIGGTPKGVSEKVVITGQIDRLAVLENEVLVVDYKTNQPPPASQEQVADAYLAQMAAYRALIQEIYPDKKVICALLWTFDTRLMVLSDAILDHAFSQFVAKV